MEASGYPGLYQPLPTRMRVVMIMVMVVMRAAVIAAGLAPAIPN